MAGSIEEKFMAESKILIVDDEKGIRDLFAKVLEGEGCSVVVAKNGREGLKKLKDQDFQVVLMDLRMPKMNGANAIIEMKKIKPEIAFIIISGFPLGKALEKILENEIYAFIRKPFSLDKVIEKVKAALERQL